MTLHRSEIEIPNLRSVATGDWVLREQHDVSRSAPLSERIQRDGRLKNPPVDIFRYCSRIYRVNTDHLDRVQPYDENVTALVVFPHDEPSEIIELARNSAGRPASRATSSFPARFVSTSRWR